MTVKLWSFETFDCTKTLHGIFLVPRKLILTSNIGHDHNVTSVCFIKSDFVVSASRDKSIRIWEVSSGFNVRTITVRLSCATFKVLALLVTIHG